MDIARFFIPIIAGGSKLNISDDFERTDGDLAGGWNYTAGKWTIASGKVVATPGDGGELLANPGFEGTYTDGLAANWTKAGTPTLTEEGTIKHGGSAAQKILAGASSDGVKKALAASSVGRLARVGVWFYCTDVRAKLLRIDTNALESRAFLTASLAYGSQLNIHGTLRVETTDAITALFAANGAGTIYADDASINLVTMADLYALRNGKANFSLRATLFGLELYKNYEYVGVAFRMSSLTNPQSGYVAYHNGTQIVVEKLTNGLWAKVGTNAAATYVAGAVLQVDANGSTVVVTYNNAVIRTDTLADYSTNTIFGLVSTHPENSFGYFEAREYGQSFSDQSLVVDPTGNDTTGNGTVELPYLTITKTSTVMAGDGQWNDVRVNAGTYSEVAKISAPHTDITYNGIGIVSIDKGLYAAFSNVHFNGFSLTALADGIVNFYHVESGYHSGCSARNIKSFGVNITRSDGAIIEDVEVLATWALRGCYFFDSHGLTINRVYVHDSEEGVSEYCFENELNADDSIYTDCWAMGAVNATHGFIAKTSSRVQYHNCVVKSCQTYGFYSKAGLDGIIQHCVADGCAFGISLNDNAGVPPYSTGWTIKNNIIMNNHTGILVESTTAFTSDYNCFYGNTHIGNYNGVEYDTLAEWQAATGQDLHSVEINPNFASEEYGGFILPVGSALLTAGEGGVAIGRL